MQLSGDQATRIAKSILRSIKQRCIFILTLSNQIQIKYHEVSLSVCLSNRVYTILLSFCFSHAEMYVLLCIGNLFSENFFLLYKH